jgi:hypothetical protein
MVQPAFFGPRKMPIIQPAVGMEEKSKRQSSEEEKYYMREYMPGDRFRDINWKVSSRLDELITRISPITQEKSTVISVFFRSFREPRAESAESIAHLNVLKSWLLTFLRRMKSDNPALQFRVHAGSSVALLATEEELERFAFELAGLCYQGEGPGVMANEAPESGGEAFVFTTPFDRNLGRFLASVASAPRRLYLFRTVPARGAGQGQTMQLFPGPLDFLPGPWVLRRERPKPPVLGRIPAASLEEEPISVRVF